MGKQSARLYYRKKDHKDIYFQGKYHNAMIVKREDDAELVWRKLYDEGYYVYTRNVSSGHYEAVLYPKYRIREYLSSGDGATWTFHSDKYFVRKRTNGYGNATISSDGKLWKRINDNRTQTRAVLPKDDGVVICDDIRNHQTQYTYIPIKDGDIDKDNALVIYTDKTNNVIFNTAGITDFLLLLDDSQYPYINALAVDMQGNVYNELFTTYQSEEIGGSGCYRGMYYCVFTNNSAGAFVYVSDSIGGPWERREFPIKATDAYVVQSDNEIVVYMSRINNISSAVRVYTTTDFVNYTMVDIPANLLIPVISSNSTYEYVNLRLSSSSPQVDNALNCGVYWNIYYYIGDISRGAVCYVEKEKIRRFKGLLMPQVDSSYTIYIDNLFFEQSKENFAFSEVAYPSEYMNDYIEKDATTQ